MPLYSYRCRGCNATADFVRKLDNRDNPAYCTSCEAWSSRRIMTAPGLIGETVVRDQSARPQPQTIFAPGIESATRFPA